jgi:hypothetical protein
VNSDKRCDWFASKYRSFGVVDAVNTDAIIAAIAAGSAVNMNTVSLVTTTDSCLICFQNKNVAEYSNDKIGPRIYLRRKRCNESCDVVEFRGNALILLSQPLSLCAFVFIASLRAIWADIRVGAADEIRRNRLAGFARSSSSSSCRLGFK